ncbi:MAG: C39 family peptidase [Bacilli bacterium]|jgi:hypothetical protein|nr:C39 family peptidase [Bacilli bacterium]
MYFLIEVCQNPGVLRALYFIDLLINALFVIVPISLIIMLLVDFFRATISNDDTAKKSAKMAGKRIISAVLVFCVPWIVNVLMELLTSAGFQTGYLECLENARSGDFAYYDNLYEDEQKRIEQERLAKIAEANIINNKSKGNYNSVNGGLDIPAYYQDDYSDVILSSGKTVACCGCGFTSSSMIVSYLTGENITPREFVDTWSKQYYVPGTGMSWGLPQAAAEHYGLGDVIQTYDFNEAYEALKDGHPVMSSQGPGIFTQGGHLIVLRGIDSNGKILVNDPNKNNAVNKNFNNMAFEKSEISASGTQYFIWPKK